MCHAVHKRGVHIYFKRIYYLCFCTCRCSFITCTSTLLQSSVHRIPLLTPSRYRKGLKISPIYLNEMRGLCYVNSTLRKLVPLSSMFSWNVGVPFNGMKTKFDRLGLAHTPIPRTEIPLALPCLKHVERWKHSTEHLGQVVSAFASCSRGPRVQVSAWGPAVMIESIIDLLNPSREISG